MMNVQGKTIREYILAKKNKTMEFRWGMKKYQQRLLSQIGNGNTLNS